MGVDGVAICDVAKLELFMHFMILLLLYTGF